MTHQFLPVSYHTAYVDSSAAQRSMMGEMRGVLPRVCCFARPLRHTKGVSCADKGVYFGVVCRLRCFHESCFYFSSHSCRRDNTQSAPQINHHTLHVREMMRRVAVAGVRGVRGSHRGVVSSAPNLSAEGTAAAPLTPPHQHRTVFNLLSLSIFFVT